MQQQEVLSCDNEDGIYIGVTGYHEGRDSCIASDDSKRRRSTTSTTNWIIEANPRRGDVPRILRNVTVVDDPSQSSTRWNPQTPEIAPRSICFVNTHVLVSRWQKHGMLSAECTGLSTKLMMV